MIDFIYRIVTGDRIRRILLTPVGLLFYLFIVMFHIRAARKLDRWLKLPILTSEPVKWLFSLPLLFMGIALTFWSAFRFVSKHGTPVPLNPPPKVVTDGPYAYTRNPMLTGNYLIFFGLGFWYKSIALTFIITPLFIAGNYFHLKCVEEKELELRLGEEYTEYKSKVPMFIPGISFRKMV